MKLRIKIIISLFIIGFIFCCGLSGQSIVGDITRIIDLRKLGREEAAKRYPVKIQGTVLWTWNNGSTFFVSDETESCFVRPSKGYPSIKPGYYVEVYGISDPGQLTPYINNANVSHIGLGRFPEPKEATIEQILIGSEDARWVQTEGVVRYVQESGDVVIIGISDGTNKLNINLPLRESNINKELFINARIMAQGVCGIITDVNYKPVQVMINVPFWTNIVFVETNRESLFNIPASIISQVRSTNTFRAIKISAEVVKNTDDGGLVIKDDSGEITVYPVVEITGNAGEEVDVVGFKEIRKSGVVIADALVRRGAPRRVLTKAASIKNLTTSEASRGYSVDITASITLFCPESNMIFVQDETGGIFVGVKERFFNFRQFEQVQITGVSDQGIRMPYIKNGVLKKTGEYKKIEAKKANFSDVVKGVEDSNFIEVRGIVRRAEISGKEPKLLIATTNREKIFLVVHEYSSQSKLNGLLDSEIVAEGACGLPYKFNRGELTVNVHLQSLTNLSVLKAPEVSIEKTKPVSVASLMESKGTILHRIVVEGELYADASGKHWINDSTGDIEVEFNYGPIPGITNIVRIAGFLGWYGNKAIIEDAVLLLKSNPESNPNVVRGSVNEPIYLPLITQINQIKTMMPEDAARGYPVWISAVVTFWDGEWNTMFIHNGEQGIYVNLRPKYYEGENGEYVEIFGYTGAGDFAPVIREPIITKIGRSSLPVAKERTIITLLTGKDDSEYVRLNGVVRDAYIQGGHLYLEICTEGTKFRTIIPGFWQKQPPTNFIDSEVFVTGACGALFNQNRQLIGVQLFAQSTNQIEVIKPGIENPFASPLLPISGLLRYSPDVSYEHRVKIEGTVTYIKEGEFVVVEDKTGGIFAHTSVTNEVSVGDCVEVAGFVKTREYPPGFEYCTLRKLNKVINLVPKPITSADVLSGDFSKEILDGRLIKISGRLVERFERKDEKGFVVQDGGNIFRALIPANISSRWFDSFDNGDIVEFVGVCNVQMDAFGNPRSFLVLLRSPKDVVVLKHVPWFDEKKLVTALQGLLGVLLISSIWVGLLKRKIKNQILIIKKQNEELERRVAERTAELEKVNHLMRENLEELEKIKDEIEQREILYRMLFENSQDAIFVEDYDGNVLDVNPSACKLHGMSREELVGKKVFDLVPEEEIENVRETFQKFVSGELNKAEGYSLAKDGGKIPVMLAVSKIEYGGKPSLLFHVRDITEIKQAQEELRLLNEQLEKRVEERTLSLVKTTEKLKQQIEERIRIEEALRQSEEKFSKAYNLSPVASIILSLEDEQIITVNDAFCALVGFEKDDIIGKKASQFSKYFSNLDKEKVFQELKEWGSIINYKASVQTKSGKNLETLVSGGILNIGNKQCALFAIHDITKLSEMETQLRQTAKMNAVGMLAAGIAHDFNNILTVVQGHAGLIRMEAGIPEEIKASANEILSTGEKASRLVKKLLTFSRQTKADFKPLNLNKAIEETTSSMLSQLITEDIRLIFRLDKDLPCIFADRTMIDEIILNLSLNARDAMPDGGTITYLTRAVEFTHENLPEDSKARPGKYVCLSISDTGHGMNENVKNRIFEPFFTTKEFGKGSGLGLAIVYGIVEEHKGWIEVDSSIGVGTTFRIYFPISEVSVMEESPAPVVQTGELVKSGKKHTILIVEDEKSLRFLLRHLLERHGYKVIEAGSGEEALKIWNIYKEDVDLLLTDIVMPDGINGHQLASELIKSKPDLKVLYSSGYSPTMLNPEYKLVEGVNFIFKPYEPAELMDTIYRCLNP